MSKPLSGKGSAFDAYGLAAPDEIHEDASNEIRGDVKNLSGIWLARPGQPIWHLPIEHRLSGWYFPKGFGDHPYPPRLPFEHHEKLPPDLHQAAQV